MGLFLNHACWHSLFFSLQRAAAAVLDDYTEVKLTCWRPLCRFPAGVASMRPPPRPPFTLLAFQVPFSAQKAYCGLNVPSASSSDAESPSYAAQSESSSFPSAVRRLNLCMNTPQSNRCNSPCTGVMMYQGFPQHACGVNSLVD